MLQSKFKIFVAAALIAAAALASCKKTDQSPLPDYVNLSSKGSANCYIVSTAGDYSFNATVRGNGKNTDGSNAASIAPTSAEVLWESFGTDETPNAGDLVKIISLGEDGYVKFTATDKKGNAVIAVKDADNKILWSWHIWLAGEQPQGQVYDNNAGTMMDRNLGATSTEKGSVGALGLLYQWGRKDPFLGSSSIDSGTDDSKTAASVRATGVSWDKVSGPKIPAEAAAIPTTFITGSSDWTTKDDALWRSSKTMYDPCPVGWRVPDGGNEGVWYKAFGSDDWTDAANWDNTHRGMDFGLTPQHKLGSGTIWYPAAGYRHNSGGVLSYVGSLGHYWSCTVNLTYAYYLLFDSLGGHVYPSFDYSRSFGFAVRCLSE